MKKSIGLGILALSLASCISSSGEAEPVASTGSVGQSKSTAACNPPVVLTAPVPPFTVWAGQLPPQESPEVVWMVTPLDTTGANWGLYQVNVVKDYIVSRTKFGQADRSEVLSALGTSLATIGGLRIGPQPGPPGEPADVAAQAKAIRAAGL
jgi:hypothetical protein